jgi:peptide-methionine (S)-S-oxide reductase
MPAFRTAALLFAAIALGCSPAASAGSPKEGGAAATQPLPATAPPGKAVAFFAGGCFWCTESDFEHVDGVLEVVSGYAGGAEKAPTYDQVSSGETSHAESIRVVYDPAKISYEKLVDAFWRSIDPVSANGQFCDRGAQYRSVIFYGTEQEKAVAERTKKEVETKLGAKVATQIVAAGPFWAAEAYHQDYAKRNPGRYHMYRTGCGRDRRVAEIRAALDKR